MAKKQQKDGCAVMMRRTFLFLVGFACFKFLSNYFAVAQNRTEFGNFVSYLWEKIQFAVFKKQPELAQDSLSNTPLPSTQAPEAVSTPTPKPSQNSNPQKAAKGKPIEVIQKTIGEISFYQTTIDLDDPETFITMGLANNANLANSASSNQGDEAFEKMVNRYPAAVIANGTFFSKDEQKRVMGNMVAGGKFLKYSRWENYGTTLGIRAGNQLEMITARAEKTPEWDQHWFSLTCGPRLMKNGKIWLAPKLEGFSDPHVLDVGYRTAIGFPAEQNKLFLITFLAALSLQEEAKMMQAIGCHEAMNLDGGASEALAYQGEILVPAGRNLTNIIVVYDTNYPAPAALKTAWQRFQAGERPQVPV
jgi:hypothetical protein